MQIDDHVQALKAADTLLAQASEYHELRNTGIEALVIYHSAMFNTNSETLGN